MIGFLSIAGKDIFDPVFGTAHIFGIEISIFVQNLCMGKAYTASTGAANGKAGPTHHILTKINHRFSLGRMNELDREYAVHNFYRFMLLCANVGIGMIC